MVIINSQNAQLANRLWGFSTFIANSIEHNYSLKNLGFHKYKLYFEATSQNNFGEYPIRVSRTGISYLDYFYSNLFKNWSSFTFKKFGKTPTLYTFYRTNFDEDKRGVAFNLNRADFVAAAKTEKVLVQGWMFRDPENIRKHRSKIIQFFKPVEPYFTAVKNEIVEAKKLADVLIGVHIRRGDYATFVGGKWFYADEDYARMMRELVALYKAENKTVAFLVCSNEDIDLSKYEGLHILSKPRHFIVDLYSLAECDAIFGPPSTFSQWAAYYGNKPLTMVLSKNQKMEYPKFNPDFVSELNFPEKELYRF
ncbi:alpha-1,2-fucosyltransferase [Pedobacter sp. MW01-1-1]|uniref:alpha-1,2-fucosyltransferase n=1 Tax=Pedobacter sp. MW01-1-1 TaxID=3383027 RepID=UPI003FEFDC0C